LQKNARQQEAGKAPECAHEQRSEVVTKIRYIKYTPDFMLLRVPKQTITGKQEDLLTLF